MVRTTKKTKGLSLDEKLDQALVPAAEQSYDIPKNWCWTTVGNLCSFVGGGTPDKSNPNYWNGTVPWASVKDIKGKFLNRTIDTITDDGVENSSTNICEPGNLILVTRIEPGKAIVSRINVAINQDLKVVQSRISSEFLYYYFLNFRHEFEKKSSGSTVKGITLPNIQNTNFPLPPLTEQQRIVDRIESIFAKLDEAKEKAQEVVDGFELRKSAILHKAFTGELTAKWREENGLKMDSWIKSTIGEQFTHATGKALKKTVQEGSLHKYITTSNLYWGTFDFSEVREMYFKEEELEKCTATKGDLLICNGGDVGRAAIWNYDYDICLQNHISKLRKKNMSVDIKFFFYYFLFSKINGNISGKGIGIASLSAKALLAMEVNLPTFCEQQEIANMLDKLFTKEQRAKEAAEAVLEQIDTMKKSVLARAFRGELGTNDPAEESAVELLKTIL